MTAIILAVALFASSLFLTRRSARAGVGDPWPQVYFESASYYTGEAMGQATLTVTLGTASDQTVTVKYDAIAGTAAEGDDYDDVGGMLTFEPGQTSHAFDVHVLNDRLDEPPETIVLALTQPVQAGLGSPDCSTLTIFDNDPPPLAAFALDGHAILESAGPTSVTVRLSAPSGLDVTLPLAFSGTATSPDDYAAISETLTIFAGDDEAHIALSVNDDVLDEDDETIILTLGAPSYAILGDTRAHTTTILDDDQPPDLFITDANVTEGDTGTVEALFTVSLSAQSAKTVSMTYATADGTATAGDDYAVVSGTLELAPGETSRAITVTVLADQVDEGDEVYLVNLLNARNAVIASGHGIGVISDDDRAGINVHPTYAHVTEGNGAARYTVALASQPVATVTLALEAGKQVALSAPSMTFNAMNWHISQTITITAVDDVVAEGAHHGVIAHHAASADPRYAGLAGPEVSVHITDNDAPGVDVHPTNLHLVEGGAAGAYEVALVTRPTATVTITLEVKDRDQVALSASELIFGATNWNVSQAVTVTAVDDWDVEYAHNVLIAHNVSSADVDYAGLDVPGVDVAITDNDAHKVYLPLALHDFSPPVTSHELKDAPDACPGYLVQIGHTYHDNWDWESDADWYSFEASAGMTYTIQTGDLVGDTDTVLTLYAGDCATQLADNDDASQQDGLASRIEWNAPDDGLYHVLARSFDWLAHGNDTGYALRIRKVGK